MSGNVGNNLAIEVSIRQDGSSFTFSRPGSPPLKIESGFKANQLGALRMNLRSGLDDFAEAAGKASQLTEPFKWPVLDGAMRYLRAAGQELGYALFPLNEVPRIQEFCRDACSWVQQPEGMPTVEIVVDAIDMAPIEFVPMFRRAPYGRVTDALSFAEEARSYLSFSAVLKRTLRQSPDQPSFLDAHPRLEAALFHFANLQVIASVVPVLTECGVSFLPPEPDGIRATEELTMALYDSILNGRYQILYFGCHCDTTDPVSGRHRILLADDEMRLRHDVTLGGIEGHFFSYGPRATPGPLVFMNACGGAAILPDGVGSFPHFFLEQNFKGYVGTETKIPDSAAADFACTFFRAFLGGRPLGESILEARRHLLHRGNPLGILYTAYAASEMVVRRTGP